MDLQQLHTFKTVVDEGGFSAAGQKLLRSQPAVSLALKKLEENLGDKLIDRSSKHRRLRPRPDPWGSAATNRDLFRRLFDRFRASQLAVSYRSDGIPSLDELASMLREFKRRVRVVDGARYRYVLSTRRGTREALLIGTDE